MEFINTTELDTIIDRSFTPEGLGLGELTMQALRGELDLSLGNIFSWILSAIFYETTILLHIIRYLLVVAILSALFKAMTSSFKTSGVAELGFYISCVLIIGLLFSSFSLALGIMNAMVSSVVMLLTGSTPFIIAAVAGSGYVASASAFAPTIIFAASGLTVFIERFLAPIIVVSAALHLISFLLGKDKLEALSDFLKDSIKFGLKSSAGVFIFVLSMQRLASPILNNLAIRSARFTVGAVPVVGGALQGAIDAAIYYGAAARGALAVGLIIAAVLVSIVPIIQLLAFVIVYRLSAALIQPLCDERIVKAMAAAAKYAQLMLGLSVLVAFLFIFIVLATLTISN